MCASLAPDFFVAGGDPLAFDRQVFDRVQPLRGRVADVDDRFAAGSGRVGRLFRGQRHRLSRCWCRPVASATRASAPSGAELTPAMPDDGEDQDDARADDHGPQPAARRSSSPSRARGGGAKKRPIAPWRIGSSTYFQEIAETTKVAAICSSARRGWGRRARSGVGEDDDRHVPEVDAVGADADPAQRPHAEEDAELAGRVGERHQHHHRAEREQDEAAAVEERRQLLGFPDHQEDDEEADDAESIEGAAGLGPDPAAEPAAGPDHRQGAPKSSSMARVSVP